MNIESKKCSFCNCDENVGGKIISGQSVYICEKCFKVASEYILQNEDKNYLNIKCNFCDKIEDEVNFKLYGSNPYICIECLELIANIHMEDDFSFLHQKLAIQLKEKKNAYIKVLFLWVKKKLRNITSAQT